MNMAFDIDAPCAAMTKSLCHHHEACAERFIRLSFVFLIMAAGQFMANVSWTFFKIDKFPITGAVFGRVPSFTHLLCGISLDEADGECVIF